MAEGSARQLDPADIAEDRADALALLDVSRETAERLDAFVALLLEWQRHTNLVAASSLAHVWTRHIADSLQLLRLAPGARAWADLGSGAGFPGLVIACALGETPGTRAHLVESIGKKCAFLSEAVRRTSAPALVHHARIEDFVREHPAPLDVVTARAVAPLDRLLGLAAPLLKIGALGLFPKGQDVGAELTAASKYWRIKAEIVPSLTAPSSGIVVVHSLERRSPR